MGGIVSRIVPDITIDHGLNESYNRLKNSFDRTPKYKMIDDKLVDPRSATLEINRTPLCLLDLADESSMGTPVVRNRKKSKRRSGSRLFETATSSSDRSSSFEFSAGSSDRSEDYLAPWKPMSHLALDSGQVQLPHNTSPSPSDDKYQVLVDLTDEHGSSMGSPPVWNMRKSKRRSGSNHSSSFEYSGTDSLDHSDPVPCDEVQPDDATSPPSSEDKYEVVVEELRRCLGQVRMPPTPVYIDEAEQVDRSSIIETPPTGKQLNKQSFWTPDIKSQPPLSPLNKERTPLGMVNSNTALSRLNSSGVWRGGNMKMWRGPAEERAKLQGENTPPLSLPPFGSPRSAPLTNRFVQHTWK